MQDSASFANNPATRTRAGGRTLWLEGITLFWMAIECGVALWSAERARSPSLLAFGSDSFVELLSAVVVLLQYSPRWPLPERRAQRISGVLLIVLALAVAAAAIGGFVFGVRPESSYSGIAITLAALVIMPVLAVLKHQEARRRNNRALAADAVQSATCAYLALIAVVGLTANALFHVGWIDSAAALCALPILVREGRDAWRGDPCSCC